MNYRQKITAKLNKKAEEGLEVVVKDNQGNVLGSLTVEQFLKKVNAPSLSNTSLTEIIRKYNVWRKKEGLDSYVELKVQEGTKEKEDEEKINGLTFQQWKAKVDAIVSSNYGLSMDDFADWNSYDSFESGVSPKEGFEDFKEQQDDLPF
jgi:hypothetical protein